MKKIITVVLVVVIALGLYIFINSKNRGSLDPGPKLTSDKIISDPVIVNSIIQKKISPKGNPLSKVVLDEDDPNILDESWRYAYYACFQGEHSGWIYDYPGGDVQRPTLYGPFEWCLI